MYSNVLSLHLYVVRTYLNFCSELLHGLLAGLDQCESLIGGGVVTSFLDIS